MTEIKSIQRRKAHDARNAQPNKDELSRIICKKFLAQAAYHKADIIMWYIHCRSEVRTLSALSREMTNNKKLVVPYCCRDQLGNNRLGLWLLEDLAELVPGTWGILEPPETRWGEAGKEINPLELDLVMVPGVAFDRSGGRLGHGAGYYDKLLSTVRPDAVLIGVCFEAQLFDRIIMDDHDIFMDKVITEQAVYKGRRGD